MADMDIRNVQMVRSAKGNDMLCVDDFLYHFLDRGKKRCRWICSKQKSKKTNCKARIATVIVNGDESHHQIVRVTNEHSHERCTQREISKVVERKLQADLAGKPCTLRCKYDKVKEKSSDDEQDKSERRWDDGGESDEWPADEEEMFSIKPVKPERESNGDSDNTFSGIFNLSKQKLYMLKTALGRQMICVEGFLYRLESRSITSTTHRWECIKQDPPCKVRILTECLPNGVHRVKDRQEVKHCHEAYTPIKLSKLLNKNNIQVLSADGKTYRDVQMIQFMESPEVEYKNTQPYKPPKKRIMDSLNNAKSQDGQPIRRRTKAQHVTYTYSADPLAAISTNTKKDPDNAKFTFLPSSKGNKVLCLDNYIFHLDTRCPRNGRAYWTCLLRRDKFYKCNARATTEMTHKGPIITRFSGKHMHRDHSEDIKTRLRRSFVAKSAEEAGISVANMMNDSGNELNEEFKQIIERTKEVIDREIEKAQQPKEDDNDEQQQATSTSIPAMKLDENSVSSFSSGLDSDDEFMNSTTALPSKLDEMRQGKSDKKSNTRSKTFASFEKKKEESFNTTYESLVEEMTAGENEMEVEYLDINAYEDDGNMVEVVKAEEDDYLDVTVPAKKRKIKQDKQDNLDISTPTMKRKIYVVDDDDDYLDVSRRTRKQKKYKKVYGDNDDSDDFDGEYDDDDYVDESETSKKKKCSKWSKTVTNTNMNIENIATLRSAKGGELLCVDGYIYYVKSRQKNNRKYWLCIKSKDSVLNCKSRLVTTDVKNEVRIIRATNNHTHPVSEADIKRRLLNEFRNNPTAEMDTSFRATYDAVNSKFSKILGKEAAGLDNFTAELDDAIGMTMKLYAVSDGPPSLAVRMVFQSLNLPYELINVDFIAGEHMTAEYAKMNPQKEIPVLDDDGFCLSESVAIMQYLCDKYAPNSQLYPRDATKRAIVNHRLCFNMGFYYAAISAHSMAPIFFDYQRSDMSLKKVNNALSVFETYLRKNGTKYAAADSVTIADFALITATLCLEAINFDLTPYPLVKKWYETFKQENPDLWTIANIGMEEIAQFEKNPPDLSNMNHPFHPTRKAKV